jgi:superfamily II DNA or RNA helicase
MKFILANKVIIEDPTPEMLAYCKSTLSFPNPDYLKREEKGKWTGNTQREIVLFERAGNRLYLPFGTCKNIYLRFKKDITRVESLICPLRAREYGSHINLYGYQQNAVEAVLRAKNGILVAPCGSGKTQMGLEAVARIGGKTLWVAHTTDLFTQSMNRAKQCFGLPASEYGTITAGKVDIGNTITFATVQTACNIDLSQYRDEWDCVIVDECHKCVGSPTRMMMFYKVLSALSARYKIGLTATPYRADGLERCMFALLGDIIHKVPQSAVAGNTVPVRVKFVSTNYTPCIDNITDGDGTLNYAKLISDITENVKRNEVIIQQIFEASRNGAVLVLSDRINHLEDLETEITMYSPYNIKCARLGIASTKAEKERRARILTDLNNGALNVVFATYKLAKEGLDVPNLRTVVFATPQKDKTTVIQSAGRVARKADGKDFGTVIDFSDNFGLLYSYERKRKNFYKKFGYIY